MSDISTTGWIALFCIVVFVVVINISLFISIRKKKLPEIDAFKRAAKGIQSPWKYENDQLHELSTRVKALKEQSVEQIETDNNSLLEE